MDDTSSAETRRENRGSERVSLPGNIRFHPRATDQDHRYAGRDFRLTDVGGEVVRDIFA
jgi:hypothetical protein